MQNYLMVYTGLSLLSIVLSVGSNALGQIAGAKARKVLHERALRSVMRSPMRFFEATPVGRLINRFATDMAVVDKVKRQICLCASVKYYNFVSENLHLYSETGAVFIALLVSDSRKCSSEPLVYNFGCSDLRRVLLGAKILPRFSQVNYRN